MERKQKIMEYRGIFDKTLASDNLANEDFIRRLVQNQLQSSPSEAQEKRIKEVTHLLDLMRSASGNDFKRSKSYGTQQAAWKLKEDNDEYRVMYREGPQGSPFHTLLAEGYVNAPLDFCLCAGWEVGLYKNW
ncbi:hypothetical protein IFM89_007346 [Coptis chinensis]|uniref:Uncharacterized protein n=1 Tax=Coptis chinensis TaxID=261450 RepID=A0A835LLK8_9MAGN|nr:hypothetical protein IFM89_007346 [Coptis chinensis]